MANLDKGAQWAKTFTTPNGTEEQIKAGHFGITLNTEGKFIDKDIKIDYTPQPAVLSTTGDTTSVTTAGWVKAGTDVGKVTPGTATSDDVNITDAKITINETIKNPVYDEKDNNRLISGEYHFEVNGKGTSSTTIEPGYITEAIDGKILVSGTTPINASILSTGTGDGAADIVITKGTHAIISPGYYHTNRIVGWHVDKISTGTDDEISAILSKTYVGEIDGDVVDKADIEITIPEGYYEAGKKIVTIDKLIPDFAGSEALSDQVLFGYKAYDENGKVVTGAIPIVRGNINVEEQSETLLVHPDKIDQTLDGKSYYSAPIKIQKTTTTNLVASAVKYNETIKVRCEDAPDKIASITGTFTSANTIVDATAIAGDGSSMLAGKAAFLNGVQVTGTIETYIGEYTLD